MKAGFFNNHKLVGGRWIPQNKAFVGRDMKHLIKRKSILQRVLERLK